MSGKSGKCQGSPFPHVCVREMSGKFSLFAMLRKSDLFHWHKNGTTYQNHHFSALCHNLFRQIYMIESSKEYQSLNV